MVRSAEECLMYVDRNFQNSKPTIESIKDTS